MAAKKKPEKEPDDKQGPINRLEGISSEIYLPRIVTFTLVGISPLLQNNPAEFIGKSEGEAELKAKKKTYKDEEEAALRCYRDGEGRYCHPSRAIIKAMIKAATGKKCGKVAANSVIRGGVFITEKFSVIEDEDGNPAKAYTIDRQPVVVGTARILRCRPSWSPWRMRVALEINAILVGEEFIRQVLMLAGITVGIGDDRPEKDGGHGRFRAA